MSETTTLERLSKVEIHQAELTAHFKHMCEKLDKIADNEQANITLLIKVVAVIAIGERLLSVLADQLLPLFGG